MTLPVFETEPFARGDGEAGFDCGRPALNEFFRRYAGQNQRQDVGRTWVLRRPADQPDRPAVLGFYTLALGALTRESLSDAQAKKLPRYPLPVALIARLARDLRAGGLRAGERLLVDAHARVLTVAEHAGCVGVIVDAKDAEAEGFYAHYGYQTLVGQPTWPKRMYLPIATLRDSLK
jgi:hypothetical protein